MEGKDGKIASNVESKTAPPQETVSNEAEIPLVEPDIPPTSDEAVPAQPEQAYPDADPRHDEALVARAAQVFNMEARHLAGYTREELLDHLAEHDVQSQQPVAPQGPVGFQPYQPYPQQQYQQYQPQPVAPQPPPPQSQAPSSFTLSEEDASPAVISAFQSMERKFSSANAVLASELAGTKQSLALFQARARQEAGTNALANVYKAIDSVPGIGAHVGSAGVAPTPEQAINRKRMAVYVTSVQHANEQAGLPPTPIGLLAKQQAAALFGLGVAGAEAKKLGPIMPRGVSRPDQAKSDLQTFADGLTKKSGIPGYGDAIVTMDGRKSTVPL